MVRLRGGDDEDDCEAGDLDTVSSRSCLKVHGETYNL